MKRRWLMGLLVAGACALAAAFPSAPAPASVSNCTDPTISVVLERADAGPAPFGEAPSILIRIRNHGTERITFLQGHTVLSDWEWRVRDTRVFWTDERFTRFFACYLIFGAPEEVVEPGGELAVEATPFRDAPYWPARWQVQGNWKPWGVTKGGKPIEFSVKSNVVTIPIANPLLGWIGVGLFAAALGGAVWYCRRWVRAARRSSFQGAEALNDRRE